MIEVTCADCGKKRMLKVKPLARRIYCLSCSCKRRTPEVRRRMAIAHRTHTDEKVKQCNDEILKGMSWKDAAAKYGISTETLARRTKELGLPRRGQPMFRNECSLTIADDPATLAYLAAMVDGEGNITRYNGTRLCWQVAIHNTSQVLMAWLEGFGGNAYWRKRDGVKPCGSWMIVGRQNVLTLLRKIVPYLLIKREKAQQAIDELTKLLERP